MQAIQFTNPQSIDVVEISEPPAPAAGETIVRVYRVGICGTDYAGYLGKMPFFSYPRIPGHELGVEVVAVGGGTAEIKPGDRCSVEPYINCQQCYSCRRGFTNCCEQNQTLGVHVDGGLRPLLLVPTRKLHPSNKLSFDQLALIEPLAVGFHAIQRAQPRPNETVLIIGAGPIGLAAAEFSRIRGARTIVMDLNEGRLQYARDSMNFQQTISVHKDDGLSELLELTEARLAEVVIDATGSNVSMSGCLRFAGFAARVVYLGITTNNLEFPHAPIVHRRELTILASRNALAADFGSIIQLVESGLIDTKPWISHTASFTELANRLPKWLEPQSRTVKAMVTVE